MTLVKDAVLLPYRLLRAAFYFANFMSVMFSGQALTSHELDPTDRRRAEQLVLWGKMVETQSQIKRGHGQNPRKIAPDNWELVRVSGPGEPEVLARGVLCFDISPAGSVIYSDGAGLHLCEPHQPRSLISHVGIVQIAAL